MAETYNRLIELDKEIRERQQQMRELMANEMTPISKADYVFVSADGKVKLSSLFGDQQELIVIHNMGKNCPYCTAFADGINGVLHYLKSRCEVVLISDDSVEQQQAIAEKRGWKFPVLSLQGGDASFAQDMGICGQRADPGFSVFHRDHAGKIDRIAYRWFHDGDEFCQVFPLLEHLKGGIGSWNPKQNLWDEEK